MYGYFADLEKHASNSCEHIDLDISKQIIILVLDNSLISSGQGTGKEYNHCVRETVGCYNKLQNYKSSHDSDVGNTILFG